MKESFGVFSVCLQTIYLLDSVSTALSETCQYVGSSTKSHYSYGYSIKYKDCPTGCCGQSTYKYCCPAISLDKWATIGKAIGGAVAGLILVAIFVCCLCRCKARQSNKSQTRTPGRHTNRRTVYSVPDSHTSRPEVPSAPALHPPPYTGPQDNPAFIDDNSPHTYPTVHSTSSRVNYERPPSYEEAVSEDFRFRSPVSSPIS